MNNAMIPIKCLPIAALRSIDNKQMNNEKQQPRTNQANLYVIYHLYIFVFCNLCSNMVTIAVPCVCDDHLTKLYTYNLYTFANLYVYTTTT